MFFTSAYVSLYMGIIKQSRPPNTRWHISAAIHAIEIKYYQYYQNASLLCKYAINLLHASIIVLDVDINTSMLHVYAFYSEVDMQGAELLLGSRRWI